MVRSRICDDSWFSIIIKEFHLRIIDDRFSHSRNLRYDALEWGGDLTGSNLTYVTNIVTAIW